MAVTYPDLLNDITADHHSGAWEVARKAIQCVESLVQEEAGCSASQLSEKIFKISAAILKAQPGMAQLANFFNTIFNTIDAETSGDAIVLSRKIVGDVRRFRELATNAVDKVAEYGAELIEEDSQVLIHSNSSTIFETISKAANAGKTFQILLTESRPIAEGKVCAAKLAKIGVTGTFFVDAAVSKAVERADLILLGADTLSEISLVNKIGTLAICLLAREMMVPCYSSCESSKFVPQKLIPRREPVRDSLEVWQNPPEGISIDSYYFDEIALELFSGIITEEGILSYQEIGGKILSEKMNKRLIEILR